MCSTALCGCVRPPTTVRAPTPSTHVELGLWMLALLVRFELHLCRVTHELLQADRALQYGESEGGRARPGRRGARGPGQRLTEEVSCARPGHGLGRHGMGWSAAGSCMAHRHSQPQQGAPPAGWGTARHIPTPSAGDGQVGTPTLMDMAAWFVFSWLPVHVVAQPQQAGTHTAGSRGAGHGKTCTVNKAGVRAPRERLDRHPCAGGRAGPRPTSTRLVCLLHLLGPSHGRLLCVAAAAGGHTRTRTRGAASSSGRRHARRPRRQASRTGAVGEIHATHNVAGCVAPCHGAAAAGLVHHCCCSAHPMVAGCRYRAGVGRYIQSAGSRSFGEGQGVLTARWGGRGL